MPRTLTAEQERDRALQDLKLLRSRLRQILDIWDDGNPPLARDRLEELAFEDVADAPLPWGDARRT